MTLHCGDCMEVMRTLEVGSIDVVIADPPYGISYRSARRTDRSQWKPQIANDGQPFVWFLRDAARVLREGGAILCFCRWDIQEAFRLAIEWAGLTTRSQIIWDRMAHGMADVRTCVAPQHDTIWYATKGRREFPGSRPKSVIRHQRLGGEQLAHPNEKPSGLMDDLVATYTAEAETVLDPFMGSGSGGLACLKAGRNFIGVEINEAYFAIAQKRLQAAQAEPSLFAPC